MVGMHTSVLRIARGNNQICYVIVLEQGFHSTDPCSERRLDTCADSENGLLGSNSMASNFHSYVYNVSNDCDIPILEI